MAIFLLQIHNFVVDEVFVASSDVIIFCGRKLVLG